jgi:hypothetical protein
VDVTRAELPQLPLLRGAVVVEVHARIHMVLDLRFNPNPRAIPDPFERGVARTWVSTLVTVLVTIVIISFHYTRDLAQGLGAAVVSRRTPTCPRMPPIGRQNVLPTS